MPIADGDRRPPRRKVPAGAVLAFALAILALPGTPRAADETTVSELARSTHFHGVAVDANDPNRLHLATHHGLFAVTRDGRARRVSDTRDDFMGFTPHPTDPSVLYASGHPATGGNLGFIESRDGGRTWRKLADGVGGPVDFHQMDVSKSDRPVIYGVHDDLQMSADGGKTWSRVGPAPRDLIDLAAAENGTLYAATRSGLRRSDDGGRNWRAGHPSGRPATMVHATLEGHVYAFIIGTGLVRRAADGWATVGRGPGDGYILHLAVSPADGARLYAITFDPRNKLQALVTSGDGGVSWRPFGASR